MDENCIEVAAVADPTEADEEILDKRKSPQLPMPELPTQELPSPNVQDLKGHLTDDEGQFTPSGTLSREGTLDE